jgi:hypothetical protein
MKNECHEGNIEEENNGYVVFKCNILRLAQELSGGEGKGVSPPTPICSRLLDKYSKTT